MKTKKVKVKYYCENHDYQSSIEFTEKEMIELTDVEKREKINHKINFEITKIFQIHGAEECGLFHLNNIEPNYNSKNQIIIFKN